MSAFAIRLKRDATQKYQPKRKKKKKIHSPTESYPAQQNECEPKNRI